MRDRPSGERRLRIEREPPAFWDSFASGPGTLLFHRTPWSKVLMEGYALDPLFCWLEEGMEPIVGMMGAGIDMKVVRIFHSGIPFGGLLGDETAAPEFLTRLITALKKRRFHAIRIAEPRHAPCIGACGFREEEVSRHIVDLGGYDTETLFEALPRMVRKAVRKSRREGLAVRKVRNRKEIDDVFELYLRTMSVNRAAAKYPKGRFLAIYDHLTASGNGVILVAEHGGRIVGSNTLVCSEDMVHDIQLSYDHRYQIKRPNDALVYASLLWTMEKGRTKFDFMGSPAGDGSLERYKAKWLSERTTTVTYSRDLSIARSAAWRLIQNVTGNPVGAWFIRKLRSYQGPAAGD